MSTALSLYQKAVNPEQMIITIGTSMAKSGMFGCSNIDQGIVFATECAARGVPPFAMLEEYNLMFGRLSKKADAMLADFNKLGGTHKIVTRSPDCVSVELTLGGTTQKFTLTWEEAQQEPFAYEGKEAEIVKALTNKKPLAFKPKYATPRSRMQMLWARTVSDAVRAMCPLACRGVYTPEEMEDEAELSGRATSARTDDEIDAEYQVVETPVPSPAVTKTEPVKSNRAAGSTIGKLFDVAYSVVGTGEADIKDFFAPHLAKFKVTAIPELTEEQAQALITGLTAEVAASKAAATKAEPAKETTKPDSGATATANANDPATDTQVAQIRELVGVLEQDVAGSAAKFKGLLLASGRNKLAELTIAEAEAMIPSLRGKQMERFFKESLQPKN